MATRIGLFTPSKVKKKKDPRTTTTFYVEVDSMTDLVAKLAEHGAKKVGLLWRDRTGETHLEGKMTVPAELTEKDFDWLSAKPKDFQTRGLYFE